MPATSTLSQEQKSVLATSFHFIEMSVVYFRSILPVVGDTDERLLRALTELAESCLRCLPEHFPDLRSPAEDRKNRGGAR